MSQEIQAVPVGSLLIDCRLLGPHIVDLAPGERQGMRATQEGYPEAVAEITANQPTLGAEAGVSAEDVKDIQRFDEIIAMIDARLPAARKLVELLEETRAKADDERHRRVFEIAGLIDVRSKGRRSSKLRAAYQKTRAYRSASALKAARTRRKNAEAEAEIEPAPAPSPAPSPAMQPGA